ncbi:MAG: tRNA-binding protein [Maribacter sp.]|nr:tRNA-binding protein [Maribacter sp.]NNK74841.1 tRNA-binding protein [Maribacter sp.]
MNRTKRWEDFSKIHMWVGSIMGVTGFPEILDLEYQVRIDIGSDLRIKKSSAQLTTLYAKEDLFGKQVIIVLNFPKKQIANFISESLILYAVEGKDVVLLKPDFSVPNVLKIS